MNKRTGKHLFFKTVAAVCCLAAARASVTGALPVPEGVMKGMLYMTVNVSEASAKSDPPPDADIPESPAPAAVTPPVAQKIAATVSPEPELLISNLAKAEVNIDELLSLPPETAGAEVLILHTHGCESYTPSENYAYEPSSDVRTTDKNFNVVRIGDEIQKELEAAGVTVIHDTTLCDEPDFNKSYSKSLEVAKKHIAENSKIKVILDVHRDSIEDSDGGRVKTNGPDGASQLMFVVGTDTGGAEHPLWRQNLAFALNLQRRIEAAHPGLMRRVNLRSSRFNQQLSTGSLILEVGSDGNTLDEALAAAKIFGQELGQYLSGQK